MNKHLNIRTIARQTLEMEIHTLEQLIPTLNDEFDEIVHLIHDNPGKVIFIGVGKSALIGQKVVATLNSTGTLASFLHAGDAIHGDLGIIEKEDIVVCLSKSGHTPEIKVILHIIQGFGNKIIGISANRNSFLHQQSDYFIWTPVEREADPYNLVSTCSTIAQLAIGDALAMCLARLSQFEEKDFARNHPGGMLGKKLFTRVFHLLDLHEKPIVYPDYGIDQVIIEMTAKRLGATTVLDDRERVIGIITDGDLRRMLLNQKFSTSISARDIMTTNPITIDSHAKATEAIQKMHEHSITQLIVVYNDKYLGMIHLHDLLNEGFGIN